MSDQPTGPAEAAPAPTHAHSDRTTMREMAPWLVLVIVAALAVGAKCIHADASVLQILATIVGICGAVLKVADIGRKGSAQ